MATNSVPSGVDKFGSASPEHEHALCLREALERFSRGAAWREDAGVRAALCKAYAEHGVGIDGVYGAVAQFVKTLGWTHEPVLVDLFETYLRTGYIQLNKRSELFVPDTGTVKCLPLEAAIIHGNLAMVEACLRYIDEIPVAATPEWRAIFNTRGIRVLEDLIDIMWCQRSAMRGPIKLAIAQSRQERLARKTATQMNGLINLNTAIITAPAAPRRPRAL